MTESPKTSRAYSVSILPFQPRFDRMTHTVHFHGVGASAIGAVDCTGADRAVEIGERWIREGRVS